MYSNRRCCGNSKLIFEELVSKLEVCLSTVHPGGTVSVSGGLVGKSSVVNIPGAFIIEKAISSLFILFGDVLRLFVPLEPSLVLLVKAPALTLQCLRRKILLICALLVVESVEQAVGIYPAVESGIIEDAQRLLWVVRRRVCVWRLRLVVIGFLRIHGYGTIHPRRVEHVQIDRVRHRPLLRLFKRSKEIRE